MKKKLKIGLFGFGNVGFGLYQVLSNENLPFEISKICVKHKNKLRPVELNSFVYNIQEIIDDDSIDIIVELVSDSAIAYEIVKQSLQKRKPVVSANKKMIADHLDELTELQRSNNTPLLYEGAVCGSIPIISLLDRYYCNDVVTEVSAICNGTSNYILTRIGEGFTFEGALAEAQQKGFAEADPGLDIKGYDSRYKLTILIAQAFGCIVNADNIVCSGIQNILLEDYTFAHDNGYDIRLIASVSFDRLDGIISAFVIPKFISKTESFSLVKDEYNAINVKGKYVGTQFISGAGAGSLPTTIAVLSDIQSLDNKDNAGYRYLSTAKDHSLSGEKKLKIYLRYQDINILNSFMLDNISYKSQKADWNYVIAEIALSDLEKMELNERKDIFVIAMPV